MAKPTITKKGDFKKRIGTSGIRGQLYETKLISIINFRVKHDDDIKEFHLASNMDNVGAFDDICLKARLKMKDTKLERTIAVFIQAKHREGENVVLTLNSKNELGKYFESYLNIRKSFKLSSKDAFFKGNFNDIDCFFVMYTTAKNDSNVKLFDKDFASKLNDLIGTGDRTSNAMGVQPIYKNDDVEFLYEIIKKQQIIALAKQIAKFLCEEAEETLAECIMSMNDDLILQYHVILAQKVLDVSDIQPKQEIEEHRICSFREEFFETNDEYIILFKNTLSIEILKKQKIEENEIHNLSSIFLENPSYITNLSKVIGNIVNYENNKLKFVKTMPDDFVKRLDKVNVSQSAVDTAIEFAAKEIFKKRQFKVPVSFGNRDLTIRGDSVKIERRLNHLTMKIGDLLKNSNPEKKVILDDSLGDGLLKVSGGIAGAVGNMLVLDENTKMLKFTDKSETLEDLAKRLYVKLHSEISNLEEYRFEVKVEKFPKLSFDFSEHDENLVKDFFSKLIFYTNQANESGVGEILKNEIEENYSINMNNFQVTSDAIFLQYHDGIQKWWLEPKEGSYLTKTNKIYENAIKKILHQPLMTILSIMHTIQIKDNNDSITFNEQAINSLNLLGQPAGTIIVTDNITLTLIKVIQCLSNKDHALLDLKYTLNLQANDYNTFRTELMNTNNEKLLIIVCNNIPNNSRNWTKRLENIRDKKLLHGKRIIIVTTPTLLETVKKYFLLVDNVVNDGRMNLLDLCEDSQKNILNNSTAIFQGEEIRLNLLLDNISKIYIEGEVLNAIIHNGFIAVGQSITSSNYEEVKELYIDRRVVCIKNVNPNIRNFGSGKILLSLYDIEDTVALITAKPGMGKSMLLTHLSLQTKALDQMVWIVRINLLDYSKVFIRWNKAVIGTLDSVKFMCNAILSQKYDKVENITIALEENGAIHLKDCSAGEMIKFELKMFLHFYNNKNIIFLFDGFDEICPHYAEEVGTLLRAVRLQNHRMWITSRSYDKVKSILEQDFGTSYEIQQFTDVEQGIYLRKFWNSRIMFKDLNESQFNNICNFMDFISVHYHASKEKPNVKKEKHQILFFKVCLNFLNYLKQEINDCPLSVINTFTTLFSECKHEIRFIQDFDTPLHLYLTAEYFLDLIKDTDNKTNKWNLNINVFTIYDRFFETKLKKIRFEEKNKIDLSNSDNIIIYERIREDFFDKHKKLGAYAVFYQDIEKLFNEDELKNIKVILEKVKEAKEKTGLIHSVTNDIPTFIHMTFTEYFAVQYICDLLKAESNKDKIKTVWDFILNVIFLKCNENIRNILGYKIKMDKALRAAVVDAEDIIFDLLLTQGKGVFTYYPHDFSKQLYLKIRLSIDEAMENGLSNFVPLLYELKLKLTNDYLKDSSRCTSKIKRIKLLHRIHTKKKQLVQT